MNIKVWLIIFGFAGMLGTNITLYLTFLKAYFNDYKTTVSINAYGEAHIEFIVLPIFLIIGIIVTCMIILDVRRGKYDSNVSS